MTFGALERPCVGIVGMEEAVRGKAVTVCGRLRIGDPHRTNPSYLLQNKRPQKVTHDLLWAYRNSYTRSFLRRNISDTTYTTSAQTATANRIHRIDVYVRPLSMSPDA